MPKSKYRPNAADVQSGWYNDRMGTLDKSVKSGGDPIKSATEENSAARTPQATGAAGPMGLDPRSIVKALANDGKLEAPPPQQELVYVQDPSAAKNPYVNQEVAQSGWFVKSDDPMAQEALVDVDVLMAEHAAKLQKAEGMVEEAEVEQEEEEEEDELEESHAPASEESTMADKYSRGKERTGFSSPEEAENWATKELYHKSELRKAGPYIGPRGGKWADPQHTIPWTEGQGEGKKYKDDPTTEEVKRDVAGYLRNLKPGTVLADPSGRGTTHIVMTQDKKLMHVTPGFAGGNEAVEVRPMSDTNIGLASWAKYVSDGKVSGEHQKKVMALVQMARSGKAPEGYKVESDKFKTTVMKEDGDLALPGMKKSYGLDAMEAWLQKSSARPDVPEETAASILEAFLGDDDELEKAGPFIGPRGGKWADAKHTIPWSEKEHGGGPKKKSPIPERISEAVSMAQEVGINATAHPKTVMSGDPGFGKPQVIEQETVHGNSLLVDKKDIGKLRDAGAKVSDKGAVSVGDLKSAVKKLKDQAGDTSLKMPEAMAKVYLKKVGAKGVKAPPGKAAEPGTPIADLMNAGLIQKEGDKFKLTAEGKKMAGLDKPTTNKKAKGKGGMKHEPPPAKNYGSGPMDFTRFEHGSYHVEDHGAGVHALYFRGARKKKPEIIGNFSSREAAKQGIDHHTKTGWSKPSSIGPEINPKADWLKTEKSMKELEDYIQKGGEGSRGGKVIGRTKSGKPIYAQTMHPSHGKFSSQDHEEAAQHHMKQGNKEGHAAHSNFAAVKKPGEKKKEVQKGGEEHQYWGEPRKDEKTSDYPNKDDSGHEYWGRPDDTEIEKKKKAMHKAMGMPSGEPCMTHGPEDGGPLDGKGKTSGASDAGMATAESTAKDARSKGKNYEGEGHNYPVAADDIRFDDEDVDLQKLTGGQALSTLSKATSAQMLDWTNPVERSHQIRSMAKSMVDNVDGDIENPQFDAPEPEAVEEEEEPTVIAKGMVRYTDAEDRRIEKAMNRYDSGSGHFAQTSDRPFMGIRQPRDEDIVID